MFVGIPVIAYSTRVPEPWDISGATRYSYWYRYNLTTTRLVVSLSDLESRTNKLWTSVRHTDKCRKLVRKNEGPSVTRKVLPIRHFHGLVATCPTKAIIITTTMNGINHIIHDNNVDTTSFSLSSTLQRTSDRYASLWPILAIGKALFLSALVAILPVVLPSFRHLPRVTSALLVFHIGSCLGYVALLHLGILKDRLRQ
jgi:hypothetical protein